MKPLKTVTTSLSSIILFCRTIDRTAGFYTEVFGLRIVNQSEFSAQLRDSKAFKLILSKAKSESAMSRGYSPVLSFEVQNFESVIDKIKLYNLPFDGDIMRSQELNIANFRGLDGEMITVVKEEKEEEVKEEEKEKVGSAEDQEIRQILKKIRL